MILRADHVAGGFFVAFGLLVIALSGDLPTGNLSLPGSGFLPKIIAVLTTAGAKVAKGTPLVILEAMKMEHTIIAPGRGTVKEIHYKVGEQVAEGAELLGFDLEKD